MMVLLLFIVFFAITSVDFEHVLGFTPPVRTFFDRKQLMRTSILHIGGDHTNSNSDNISSSNNKDNTTTNNNIDDHDMNKHVRSVNYHISRECNYACKFCFHTQKNTFKLSLEEAKTGLKLLKDAGTEKINFAGGEPFLDDVMLGELCRYSSADLGMTVSIISNGSLIRPYWMEYYGKYVDILGISIDSCNPETNEAIGRGSKIKNKHIEQAFEVRKMCYQHDIVFKMNTVVCNFNWQEDMTEFVRKMSPSRWKVFQVLILGEENSGLDGELRDATNLVVSDDQFWSFVDRHKGFDCIVPEPNNLMQNSYLLLDERMCFMDSSNGSKIPGDSILDVGVYNALKQVTFDNNAFHERGAIYQWKNRNNDN